MTAIVKGKPIKRRKAVEFTADYIDNTAPVPKLLDDLQHKNKQAFSYYCQTVRQRRTTKTYPRIYHYTVPGHPLNAFSDEWEGDLQRGFFEQFTHKCSYPKIINKMRNIKNWDPVTELLRLKSDWHRDSRNLKSAAASTKMMKKYEAFNESVVQCPKHFVDMAAHLDSDPDPYFNSSYNWLYAGNGNLQLISFDWVDYLLHSDLSTLFLSQFSRNDLNLNEDFVTKFECEGNNILETIYSKENIVALRTRLKIYILKIATGKEKLTFNFIKSIESEHPFTSISFDCYHKNILYVTSLDCKTNIINLDRMTGRTVKLKCKVDSIVNNWNSVFSSDRVTFTHIARNCITRYDKRTCQPCHSWNSLRNITDDAGCNDISVAKQPEQSNRLYFGTDHHLFLVDVRNSSSSKPKVLQRWTHGMQCIPTFVSIGHFEHNKELICLNSQWCEDTCLIANHTVKQGDVEFNGIIMPYHAPSILDTLSVARENLLCYNLYSPIDERLCTSITGNLIMEHGENYYIILQNSLGDLSCQILYPEHLDTFMIDNSHEYLHEWAKSYHSERRHYEVSSIVNFLKVWKKLKSVPNSHFIGQGKLMSQLKSKFDEKEIFETFNTEKVDVGLLDVWMNSADDNTEESVRLEESSNTLHLHYSDGDSE